MLLALPALFARVDVVELGGGGGRYTNALVPPTGSAAAGPTTAGLPLALWNLQAPNGGPAVAATRCADAACGRVETIALWRGAGDPRYIDASLSPDDGALIVAFSAPELHVLRCVDDAGGAGWAMACSDSVIDAQSNAYGSAYPSIAFHRTARAAAPLIAYHARDADGAGGVLRVVACADATCRAAPPPLEARTHGYEVGSYPHIALDPIDGTPTVAYLNASAGDSGVRHSAAMTLRCADSACAAWEGAGDTTADGGAAGGPFPRVVDDAGVQVGSFPRLVFPRADGRPRGALVMYTAEGAGQIRTAYCARDAPRGRGSASRVHGNATAAPRCAVRVAAHAGVQMYGEFPSLVLSPGKSPVASSKSPVSSSRSRARKHRTSHPRTTTTAASGYAVGAFFNQTSTAEGALRLLICCDAACAVRRVETLSVGKCGYGRDASVAFGDTKTYISFLDYNGDGKYRYARIAIRDGVAGSECAEVNAEVIAGDDDGGGADGGAEGSAHQLSIDDADLDGAQAPAALALTPRHAGIDICNAAAPNGAESSLPAASLEQEQAALMRLPERARRRLRQRRPEPLMPEESEEGASPHRLRGLTL